MEFERVQRPVAVVCGVVTLLAIVYTAIGALIGWEPAAGPVFQAVMHLAVAVLVVTTAATPAVGTGRARTVGLVGLAAAALGFVLLVIAELTFPFAPDAAEPIFDNAPILAGLGLVVGGGAVVAARGWRGWHRAPLLVAGLYTFVVLAPALIVSGGPPAPVALWAIAGWELCFTALAVALGREAAPTRSRVAA